MPPTKDRTEYRQDVDGLRALAITGVLLFHLGVNTPLSSYLGVDVFFVISGFLISGILYRSISTETFSFSQFWLRRAKRLAPCFVCVSAATSLFAYTILLSTEWNSLSQQILASTFFVSNHWTLHAVGDYWGQQAESIPFLHFWSLSIEEQFYLFFPVMLFVSHRVVVSKQKLLLVFALTCFASLGLAFFVNPKYPSYCFYLLPTRAWELLIGVLAFFIHDRWQHQHPKKYWWWSALGLVLVIYAFNASRTASGYSLKLAFATCIGTSLCCIFEPNSKSIVGFLLSNRLSTMIGRLPYSLYLWHWPVIVFADFAGFDNSFATLLVIILLSTASYFLIETPFRQMSITTFKKWTPALVAILLLSVLAPRVIPRESTSYSLPQFESTINLAPKYGPGRYREQTGTFQTGLQIRSTSSSRPQIILLGDSHSLMFFPAVHTAADSVDANLIFFGADGGTTPFLVGNDAPSEHYFDGWSDSERVEFDDWRLRFINSNAPNIAVVCGNWNSYRNKWGDIKFKEKLLELLNACPETEFLLIEQPPILPFGSEGFQTGRIERPILREFKESAETRTSRLRANDLILEICEQSRNATFCSLHDSFNSGENLRFCIGGQMLYKDDDHLSIIGAHLCDEFVRSALEQILNSTDP